MSSALVVPVLLLVLLAPGEAGEAACSAQQMQGAWLASLATSCRPRPTLLSLGDLVTPAPGHTLAHPTHVEVDRCAGSCSQGQYINDLTFKGIYYFIDKCMYIWGSRHDICFILCFQHVLLLLSSNIKVCDILIHASAYDFLS